MSAEDFERSFNADRTPAGRYELCRLAVERGDITHYQALKLLDIDTSKLDQEYLNVERSMRVAAATNPLLGGHLRVVPDLPPEKP